MLGSIAAWSVAWLVAAALTPGAGNAGPDWLWSGGRDDPLRNLFFRRDGRFRRFGRLGLGLTVGCGLAAALMLATGV